MSAAAATASQPDFTKGKSASSTSTNTFAKARDKNHRRPDRFPLAFINVCGWHKINFRPARSVLASRAWNFFSNDNPRATHPPADLPTETQRCAASGHIPRPDSQAHNEIKVLHARAAFRDRPKAAASEITFSSRLLLGALVLSFGASHPSCQLWHRSCPPPARRLASFFSLIISGSAAVPSVAAAVAPLLPPLSPAPPRRARNMFVAENLHSRRRHNVAM